MDDVRKREVLERLESEFREVRIRSRIPRLVVWWKD